MTDPITGAPSDADDPGTQSGTGGDTAGDTATGAPSGAPEPATPPADVVPRSVVDAMRLQLQAADRKRDAAEKQLKAILDKDLPEAERLKKEHADLTAENERLKADLQAQAIDTAFRDETKYAWHDPKAARLLLDLSGVTVSDDRSVSGMSAAVAALAKANPWMLKAADTPADAVAATASGGAPPMNGKPGTAQPDKTALARRFPALGSRRGP